jgi:hypothetical protein
VKKGIGSHLKGKLKEIGSAMQQRCLLNWFGGKKSRET